MKVRFTKNIVLDVINTTKDGDIVKSQIHIEHGKIYQVTSITPHLYTRLFDLEFNGGQIALGVDPEYYEPINDSYNPPLGSCCNH